MAQKSRGPRASVIDIDQNAPANVIITKFGGLAEASRKTGIATSTIWVWAKSGLIPQKRWAEIMAAGAAHKIKITQKDFLSRAD